MLTNDRVPFALPALNEMSLLSRKCSGEFSAVSVSKNPTKPSATALV
jgi:hypothetical protein